MSVIKTAKEQLEHIRKLVFGEEAPAAVPPVTAPVALATEYKLADGTSVTIDKLEAGGVVMIGETPAPDGDITLEDGTVVSIAAGIITVVTPKAAPAEPAPQEMSTPEQFQEALQKFADTASPDQQGLVVIVKALFESVFGWQLREAQDKATREAAIEVYRSGFEAQTAALKELLPIVEKLAETEIAAPAEVQVSFEDMTPLEKYRATK